MMGVGTKSPAWEIDFDSGTGNFLVGNAGGAHAFFYEENKISVLYLNYCPVPCALPASVLLRFCWLYRYSKTIT